ncbi:MAG: hypothetical protein Q7S18_03855 [bacterium]|nr:hypothetical protein [bacterium]
MSTENPKNKTFPKIKRLWLKYEQKIILTLAFALVAVLAFEAGILKGEKWQKPPLIIEKPVECANTPENLQDSQKTQNLTPQDNSNKIGEEVPKNSATGVKSCPFVGSKNSNKYYPPTCSFAKRIKPENIVCFKDEKDAESRGYIKSTACFK